MPEAYPMPSPAPISLPYALPNPPCCYFLDYYRQCGAWKQPAELAHIHGSASSWVIGNVLYGTFVTPGLAQEICAGLCTI